MCIRDSPGNEQQFYWGSEVGKKEGSKNYAGVDSEVVDFLIEKLIGAKSREELTAAVHALDRVLLWGHYVIPKHHSNIDRIGYWNFLEFEKPLHACITAPYHHMNLSQKLPPQDEFLFF